MKKVEVVLVKNQLGQVALVITDNMKDVRPVDIIAPPLTFRIDALQVARSLTTEEPENVLVDDETQKIDKSVIVNALRTFRIN